jgi:hypothetical protein
MLPEGMPMAIGKNRSFYVEGMDFPHAPQTWTQWKASGDHLCSILPPHEPLPPFVAMDTRENMDVPSFSSLAMVINGHTKLQQFMRERAALATPRVQRFAQLIAELVVEFFFVPPGYEDMVRMGGSLVPSAEGPEPCEEDGLTDTEFRLVSARARDPHLNGQERAAAAITMLFGTYRK